MPEERLIIFLGRLCLRNDMCERKVCVFKVYVNRAYHNWRLCIPYPLPFYMVEMVSK